MLRSMLIFGNETVMGKNQFRPHLIVTLPVELVALFKNLLYRWGRILHLAVFNGSPTTTTALFRFVIMAITSIIF